ncbi:helix-turn-helix domain-containing protein [Anaerococcus tetradius]|nr:helix-turn-helix domain-containing protein [Anaerococcus tetradius]
MSYKHLTINERNKIEVLRKEGYSSRRIALFS